MNMLTLSQSATFDLDIQARWSADCVIDLPILLQRHQADLRKVYLSELSAALRREEHTVLGSYCGRSCQGNAARS